MRLSIFSFVTFFMVCTSAGHAQQSGTGLERQRQETLRQLKGINHTYNEVRKNKKASLSQLYLVRQKIRLRNNEIANINAQVRAADDSLFFINREIYRLNRDLDTLKADYAKSLIYAYSNRSSYDFLSFLFSATSFNDALRRVHYLEMYRTNRERQAGDIVKTEGLIGIKAKAFANARVQREEELVNDTRAKSNLEEEKRENDAIVEGLKSRETELAANIRNKKRELSHLQLGVESVIRHDIEKATVANPGKIESRRSARADVLLESPESINLAKNFYNSRGRLPWPVDNGWVVAHYGVNVIERTHLTWFNPGLSIGTDVAAPVKSTFDGAVDSIMDIDGKWIVVIKHGNYFCSYGNLASVSVSKGDKVRVSQMIGTAANGESGAGQLEFILVKDMNGMDPEPWLRPMGR